VDGGFGSGTVPASALTLAARCGKADVVARRLERRPDGDLRPALELAQGEGFDDVTAALRAAGIDAPAIEPREYPSEPSLDAAAKSVTFEERLVVLAGAFGRYVAAEPDTFDKRVAVQIFLGENAEMGAVVTEVEAVLRELGFARLGGLVCDRIKDVTVRGYCAPAALEWAVWNLGALGAARELVTQFEDDSGLATTTPASAGDPARTSYSLCLPWASIGVLAHKHAAPVAVKRRPAKPELKAFAAAIDRSLVKQVRS
jgi:hypothetical protein